MPLRLYLRQSEAFYVEDRKYVLDEVLPGGGVKLSSCGEVYTANSVMKYFTTGLGVRVDSIDSEHKRWARVSLVALNQTILREKLYEERLNGKCNSNS